MTLQAKACNFIKKEILAQVFSCKSCENFKNTFQLTELTVVCNYANHMLFMHAAEIQMILSEDWSTIQCQLLNGLKTIT